MARFRMMACACRKPLVPSGLAAWFRSLSLSTSPSTVITIRFSSQSMRHTWNLDDHSASSKAATGLRRARRPSRGPDEIRQQRAAIVLHDVNLAIGGPWAIHADRPEGGPQAGA